MGAAGGAHPQQEQADGMSDGVTGVDRWLTRNSQKGCIPETPPPPVVCLCSILC